MLIINVYYKIINFNVNNHQPLLKVLKTSLLLYKNDRSKLNK